MAQGPGREEMSNAVTKSCVGCAKKFETSKFTPYVVQCGGCKKVGKIAPTKSAPKPEKPPKVAKPAKSEKKEKKQEVVLPHAVPVQKTYYPAENKEQIFLHLLGKGYKLSGMNTPYKVYDKVKVMCPLSDAYTKIIVNYFDGNRFDGSNILMSKKEVKDLPAVVREDLAGIFDLLFPEAK
jgi:hypothetical protein